MLLARYAIVCAITIVLAGAALGPAAEDKAPLPKAALVCPATISVSEAAVPVQGWTAPGVSGRHDLERISVFNKDAAHEYDLAPDDEKKSGRKVMQDWELQAYRTLPLYLACRYHDTSVVLFQEIPTFLDKCTLTLELDKEGTIAGKSTMVCR